MNERAEACKSLPWPRSSDDSLTLSPSQMLIDAVRPRATDERAETRYQQSDGEPILAPMGAITWGPEIAAVYDKVHAAKFEKSVLDPMLDRLSTLAKGGRVLEFAVGTGRVALALSARGIPVQGIELSPHMVEQLRAKPGTDEVPVTIGDMTRTRVSGHFELVYLVANTHHECHDTGGTGRGVCERSGSSSACGNVRA